MTLTMDRPRGPGFADPAVIRKAINQRLATNILLDTPPKPDPDVLALCAIYLMDYDRARVLKCLSYGMPCDTDLLAWAANISPNITRRYRSVMVHRHIQNLKHRPAGFHIEKISRRTFIITDQTTLQAIKLAMDAPP